MLTSTETDYTVFKRAVAPLVPLRLDLYKEGQMERRIRDLARKHGAGTLRDFVPMLRANRELLRQFEQHLTINVSECYRNPESFDHLVKVVLPELRGATRQLRVWSAGCSYGAEPYTLAMLLHDADPSASQTIHATDIDREILARARTGAGFSREDITHLPRRLRERYVSVDGPPYTIARQITPMIRFERHDLLQDPAPGTFDLIVCRNVVIYFTDEAKQDLYRKLSGALRPSGYLFIGATEVISGAAGFGLRYAAPCFYQRAER